MSQVYTDYKVGDLFVPKPAEEIRAIHIYPDGFDNPGGTGSRVVDDLVGEVFEICYIDRGSHWLQGRCVSNGERSYPTSWRWSFLWIDPVCSDLSDEIDISSDKFTDII